MNILLLFFLTVLTLFIAAMYHIVVIVTPNVPCAASLTTLWRWGVGGGGHVPAASPFCFHDSDTQLRG